MADDHSTATPDDELVRTLRRADPAALLTPLDPEQRSRLLEDVMTEHTATTDPAPAPAARNRRRKVLIGAAAAVVILGGGATWALSGGNDTPARQPTALSMAAGGPASLDCVALTPELVAQAATAFEGTVTSIENGVVTLRNTHTFKGDVAPTVTVAQGTGSVVDGAPVTFAPNTTYLIAAGPDGTVGGCGPSGPASPELRTLFDRAFGG
jgi:hypothetical protein